MLYFNVCQFI